MKKPIIYWIRRDFRIHNNPALKFAVESKQPIIPIFIKDEFVDNLGSAPKWRLGLGLEYLANQYKKYGVEVIFRTGSAEKVLTDIINEAQANQVVWARTYLPTLGDFFVCGRRLRDLPTYLPTRHGRRRANLPTYFLPMGT